MYLGPANTVEYTYWDQKGNQKGSFYDITTNY